MSRKNEITIYDIARELSLSPTTVSRALNGNTLVNKKTVNKVVYTAQKLGYRRNVFASNLRSYSTRTIGVIIPRINSDFQSTIIAGIEQIVNQNAYHVVVAQSAEDPVREQEIIWNMFNLRVDGLLISLSVNSKTGGNLDLFSDKNVPLVFFDRLVENDDSNSVIIDNFGAGYALATHLIENGCKKIMHLCGNQNSLIYRERNRGMQAALYEQEETEELPYVEMDKGIPIEKVVESFIKTKRHPDGIICMNDDVAIQLIYELRKNNIQVPRDIAITGFNNDRVSAFCYPGITTIDNPAFEIGNQAAGKLIDMIHQPNHIIQSERIVLRPRLIIRNSSLLGKND